MDSKLSVIRSRKINVLVKKDNQYYKIIKIVFNKSDGSIFVNLPNYKKADGIVAKATMEGNAPLPMDINLQNWGKVTTSLVKFSYRPDGEVHFSQDGKVKTEIRKKSLPLAGELNHFFTLQSQGFDNFERLPNKPNDKSNERYIDFDVGEEDLKGIKIVGRWQKLDELNFTPPSPGKNINPSVIRWRNQDGSLKLEWSFVLGQPQSYTYPNHVLLLSFIPLFHYLEPANQKKSSLSFMGGFDPPDIVNDLSIDTSFLTFIYPIENIDLLKNKIGSIDFSRSLKT